MSGNVTVQDQAVVYRHTEVCRAPAVRLLEQPPEAAAIGELLGGRKGDGYILCEAPPFPHAAGTGPFRQNVPVPFSALPPCWWPAWPTILQTGLGHRPYLLAAYQDERLVGYLPLCLVAGPLFGRFLVSLPYLNTSGVLAVDGEVAASLIDRAVQLADELDVRYLELRQERRIEHPALSREMTGKVHMRLSLPATADELWRRLKAKVRNQVRKGREQGFEVHWSANKGVRNLLPERPVASGMHEEGCIAQKVPDTFIDDFYAVFSRNMRDLGTPVFGRRLFQAAAERLPEQAEFCVLREAGRPIAAALLVHGQGITEVPSASTLRRYNPVNANMLLYWHLLERAIERGQQTFDFGRSSVGSGTYNFKKQWGAEPQPAVWQYYVRRGDVGDMRPDNAKYRAMIGVWRRLPVWLTRLVGPAIVRGIP